MAVALTVSACGGSPAPTTTAPTSTTAAATTTIAGDPLDAFQRIVVLVSGEPWTVAVADTPALRDQGLMGVTDLGDLDGMFFVFEGDTDAPFWMKDTLIPLDIAFFSASGTLVDQLSMTPCTADPCPLYRPSGTYRFAIEAPVGAFAAMDRPTLAVTEG